MFPGKFQFKNLGGSKATFQANIKSEKSFWAYVGKYLMSHDIDWTFDIDKNEGKIYVGGFREVGQFYRLGEYEVKTRGKNELG